MAGGEDLIGNKVSPRGTPLGVDVRAGDTFHRLNVSAGNIPYGPVVSAVDPISGLTRFFRFGIVIQNNGDGTTSPVTGAVEIDAEGNVIPE